MLDLFALYGLDDLVGHKEDRAVAEAHRDGINLRWDCGRDALSWKMVWIKKSWVTSEVKRCLQRKE